MSSAASVEPVANRRPARRFSDISDKQISQAAIRGRRVTFKYLGVQPAHEVTGYVVGMDDYHWLVASVVPESGTDPLAVSLVHKSRADLIQLHSQSTLDGEPAKALMALRAMGASFWTHCQNTYGPTPRRT